jgi:hypothetical protein
LVSSNFNAILGDVFNSRNQPGNFRENVYDRRKFREDAEREDTRGYRDIRRGGWREVITSRRGRAAQVLLHSQRIKLHTPAPNAAL